ncbi:hypothetical protein HUT16_37180 [Kitasatospora sp. NA04385]|uniref:hypothetical protein n=1 Tax=Kitasatospora sp. NA04385 TaxID=2742135 RepID=UPI0015903F18|nr:hypothetical protein [Kitasatospora sp. NA04385]QKW17675.1 hypothetical protein HUT16_00085 [Kitasatospora sp. NA04385]QKW23970.1 hypothetical protein HUT16_37180 [Kitasatospora sp. NA04385]
MLAAVLAGGADAAGFIGAGVADLPMDGLGGALDLLQVAGRLAVRVVQLPPGLGVRQCADFLAADRESYAGIQDLAEDVLCRYLDAAPSGAVPTVRQCAREAVAARPLCRVALALGVGGEDWPRVRGGPPGS